MPSILSQFLERKAPGPLGDREPKKVPPVGKGSGVTKEMMDDTRYMDSLTGEPRPEAFHRGKAPHYTHEGSYGYRRDGTPKGVGYFGELPNIDAPDMYSTELTTEGKINGKNVSFPLLVPTLNRPEIDFLLDSQKAHDPQYDKQFKSIYQKAKDFASERISKRKSPYAEPHEFHELPNE